MIIDGDQHLFERPDLWTTYCDPADRSLALTIEPDDLGFWWLTCPATGQRIEYAWISVPEDGFAAMGGPSARLRGGLTSEVDYARDLPDDYWDPRARVQKLDEFGLDETVLIPNWTLGIGRHMGDRLDIIRANLAAWNRWAVEVQHEGKGRLHGVGRVTVRGDDLSWFAEQVRLLAEGGVRLALMNYGLVDGRRLSSPSLDRVWQTLVDHGITPVWHVVDSDQTASCLPEGWFEDDYEIMPATVEIPFYSLGVQVALTDLVMHGVLDRHPRLNICIVENRAHWLPRLAQSMDLAYDLSIAEKGAPLVTLPLRPSEYVARQVKLTASPGDPIAGLVEEFPEQVMFGSDYPHCEGLREPLAGYRASAGDLAQAAEARLYGGNLAQLVH